MEKDLSDFLKLKDVLFVNNGTTALQLAIKSLNLKGEVITTPFSFVATTSTIVWGNCTPIFVDIDKDTLNIDPHKIEASITNKTTAILATHVFGSPCDVYAIAEIAKKHNLKVIYDGAHAFDVNVKGSSIFNFGDISICSTHATKTFHTIEGGFLVTKNDLLFQKLKSMRNFGFKDETTFSNLGINAKNSEFHAGMGVVNLKYQEKIRNKRKLLSELYDELLKGEEFIKQKRIKNTSKNYSYYPIIFKDEITLLNSIKELNVNEIYPRRYFYPSLSKSLNYVGKERDLPVVNSVAKRVLCLPLFYDLKTEDVIVVCDILKKVVSKITK